MARPAKQHGGAVKITTDSLAFALDGAARAYRALGRVANSPAFAAFLLEHALAERKRVEDAAADSRAARDADAPLGGMLVLGSPATPAEREHWLQCEERSVAARTEGGE